MLSVNSLRIVLGDRTIVEAVDFQESVAVGAEHVLLCRRTSRVDEARTCDPARLEVAQHEVFERVVAQHRREAHLGAGLPQVLRHDPGPAHEVGAILVLHAESGRLGAGSDRRAVGVRVHDRVANDMDAHASQRREGLAQLLEAEAFPLHQRVELGHGQVGWLALQDRGRGVHHVARSEQQLAAVCLECLQLLLGLGVQPFAAVLVAFREVVRLQVLDVLDRRLVVVDDDVVHDLERRQVHRAQRLRHEGTEVALLDVDVGGQARDQDVRLALREQQMADVAGMDEVERSVAHDDALLSRTRPDHLPQLLARLDLPLERGLVPRTRHGVSPAPRNANQVFVACWIESTSQTGALRQ